MLYIASATPGPLKSYTLILVGAPPLAGVYTSSSLPGPGAKKSDARYCVHTKSRQSQAFNTTPPGGHYLVTECVTPNHNGVLPAGHWLGDTVEDDWLSEDCAAEDVAYGAVRALPHLLEVELLHACLIRGDCRALDADFVLENGLCRLDGDLVACLQNRSSIPVKQMLPAQTS